MQEDALQLDLHPISGVAGNESVPGSPLLHLNLQVDPPTGWISGDGLQIQVTAPPFNEIKISNITGNIRRTSLGNYTRIVSLKGEAEVPFLGSTIGNTVTFFTAQFAINDSWTGDGGWTLGAHSVDNVPFRSESQS
ncbi:MAG: DUF1842 domain-containing protein [Deltaproteobacteria bacterium]|nr:DUF1842 domain-containing protein [Deltaproteobacteria bacterium]